MFSKIIVTTDFLSILMTAVTQSHLKVLHVHIRLSFAEIESYNINLVTENQLIEIFQN